MSMALPPVELDVPPTTGSLMSAVRAGVILAGFLALTLPLMPVQAALIALGSRAQRQLPQWYHRQVCKLIGIKLDVQGKLAQNCPLLVVANHTSWLDIPVVASLGPVSFIAKKEVGTWPFISWLAKLQRTLFIDRNKRADVARMTLQLTERLAMGDAVVLFAEATSSDGNRVLPFKTSLFAAVKPARDVNIEYVPDEDAKAAAASTLVQTLSIAYTRLHGLPIRRTDRPLISWYGDMDMVPHAWQLLKAGPIDVVVRIGEPVPLAAFADRKALAQAGEQEIRAVVRSILRGADKPAAKT